jgi:lipopolysaccharide assembly protein A
MRFVYIGLIVLVTAVLLLFKFQNLTSVTVQFLSMSYTMPMTVLIILVYLLGMFTGGTLWWLLRTWYQGAFDKNR